jgi:formate hydrogenlyase subunit 4
LPHAPAGAAAPSSLSVDSGYASHQSSAEADSERLGREHAAFVGLGAIRGLRYALAAEAAVILALIALWTLWHTLR